jgi:hypothetical protein
MVDPSPLVVTTSLVHRELHTVPVRLPFDRAPWSDTHAASSTSSIGVTSTPLIHPLNKPLCPVIRQAIVLSTTEYQSSGTDTGFGPRPDRVTLYLCLGYDSKTLLEVDNPFDKSSVLHIVKAISSNSQIVCDTAAL